ncbi:MAG TPA: hypothetical protein DEP85_01575 [Holosporales bacterium]|nr:hypothetical protein [Holosporales bacterium]
MAVVLCSYFAAKMVSNFLALSFEGGILGGAQKVVTLTLEEQHLEKQPIEAYSIIVERNIFDSRDVLPEPGTEAAEEEEQVITTGEAQVTSLPIKLISTFSVGAGTDKRSTCIISAGGDKKGGAQDIYTVEDGKQFAPETKIVKILYNRVEFINKKRLEYVELQDFTKGLNINQPPQEEKAAVVQKEAGEKENIEQSAEGQFVIDRAEIDNAIANLDKLYTQIRAVPHFKDGKPAGLKLLSIKSGSVFSKLGLQRGDILMKINDTDLDIKKGLEIFNQLKTENSIKIDVERKGATQTLNYEIR